MYNYQIVAIIVNFLIIIILIDLIRRRKLKENYALIWFLIFIFFLIFSFKIDFIIKIGSFLGIAYTPSAIFLILIAALYLFLLYLSVIVSELKEENKNLIQEIGLLKLKSKKRQKK